MGVSTSALKWQGWLVGLVTLAGLLVFAPLGLYVWASGGAPRAPAPDIRVTGCRVDPASHRVVATLEATGHGSYVVTVEFRDQEPPHPGARATQSLLRTPPLLPTTPQHAEALGPSWPEATIPWCGVSSISPAGAANHAGD